MAHTCLMGAQTTTKRTEVRNKKRQGKTATVQATRRTLPVLVSRTAKATADTRAFEMLAGRSAMVGCVVAVVLEAADAMHGKEQAIMEAASKTAESYETYGAGAVVMLCVGACVAGGGLAALFTKQRSSNVQVDGEAPSPQDIAEAATKAIEALATKKKAKTHA